MVELKEITKRFDSIVVLDHLSHQFAASQTHVLLGSSGSGKSTLLRVILGLIKPDAGSVIIDGVYVKGNSHFLKNIGYVPQDAGLFPHLTAGDNILLMAKLSGFNPAEIPAKLTLLCEMTGLTKELLRRFPKELSGGQKQRVAIMRAAFLNPKLMVLDEPLGALDPIIRAELQKELKRIFKELGKTVLLVTHDLAEAAYLGDTVTLINKGRIEQTGKFRDLMQNPSSDFVRGFVSAQRQLHAMDGGS